MLKPWPTTAIIIVAANAGQEKREQMDGAVPVVCRDCNAALMADTFTIDRAIGLPCRKGRPVEFLCLTCLPGYDRSRMDYTEDHRNHKGRSQP